MLVSNVVDERQDAVEDGHASNAALFSVQSFAAIQGVTAKWRRRDSKSLISSCAISDQLVDDDSRMVEKLSVEIDRYSTLCSRLFPGHDLDDLLKLTRDELISLASPLRGPDVSMVDAEQLTGQPSLRRLSPVQPSLEQMSPAQPSPGFPSPAQGSPMQPSPGNTVLSSEHVESSASLVALQHAPELDPAVDEASRRQLAVQSISDDVNGLSLSLGRPSSYVGVSSINTALKVIFNIAPHAQAYIAQECLSTTLPSRAPSPSPEHCNPAEQYTLPSPDIAQQLIESYFKHVHLLMPMIDEDHFRRTYLYEDRRDSPWLALLNVVMALGSLASGTCDNEDHLIFFKRASGILSQRSLGSGNLLVLQAHGLLSGYYLHWLNRPNEAHALMGATFRMATAVGLHREYKTAQSSGSTQIPVEIRRRTWWSLVCLDTWASMTTGRPSFGRTGPGITVQMPVMPQNTNNAQFLASLKLLALSRNITFCTLATQIQDRLATTPLLLVEELVARDAELVRWHDDLPPILRKVIVPNDSDHRSARASVQEKSPTEARQAHGTPRASNNRDPEYVTCPDMLKAPRALMHWWYLTIRILMHRPYLAAAALRRVPDEQLSAEEKYAIEKCRAVAGEAIMNISRTCRNELVAGWNAVWLMYQAVMVPLISLFSYASHQRAHFDKATGVSAEGEIILSKEAEDWRAQVLTAIRLFDRMAAYSMVATKSKLVVERLLAASMHAASYRPSPRQKQHLQPVSDRHSHIRSGIVPEDGASSTSVGKHKSVPRPVSNDYPTDDWNTSVLGQGLDLLWDDMTWDGVSDTLGDLPFVDTHTYGFDDIFGHRDMPTDK